MVSIRFSPTRRLGGSQSVETMVELEPDTTLEREGGRHSELNSHIKPTDDPQPSCLCIICHARTDTYRSDLDERFDGLEELASMVNSLLVLPFTLA